MSNIDFNDIEKQINKFLKIKEDKKIKLIEQHNYIDLYELYNEENKSNINDIDKKINLINEYENCEFTIMDILKKPKTILYYKNHNFELIGFEMRVIMEQNNKVFYIEIKIIDDLNPNRWYNIPGEDGYDYSCNVYITVDYYINNPW